MNWKNIPQPSKASFFVLCNGPKELGFIHKPKDTRTDKNAWRVHLGIGANNQFIGHEWTKARPKICYCKTFDGAE